MSSDRTVLRRALDRGEEENGSIEFKERLTQTTHLENERRDSLAAQLRHRVLSGDGEATYVIGVTDSGEIIGLGPDEFSESLDVLSLLAADASSHIDSVETWDADVEDDERLVGLATVRDGARSPEDDQHLIIGTAGHVDHGKSTLVGSLVTGAADDGDGETRSYLDVQPHEVERGLSADLSYAVYGFSDGEPLQLSNPDRKDERSKVVSESDRLVSFVDTVGHTPWLHTTIRGLVGQRLDYGMVAVAADDGPTETTQEHLGILLAMDLPTVIVITKTDMVSESRVEEVEQDVERMLRDVGCSPLPIERHGIEAAVEEISEQVIPIVKTSAVEMDGLDSLHTLFQKLPKTTSQEGDFSMYVDRVYNVEGVGAVVSGTVRSGDVSVGDDVILGPTEQGEFIETKVKSIEIHHHRIDTAKAGQLASFALQNVSEEDVRRGMMLAPSGSDITPVKEFQAEMMVLNHPTKITNGYEPVVHLETISETVRIYPESKSLLPGDTGKATFEFKFNPYVIEEGQRFIFREGQSKGVGTVTKVPDSGGTFDS